MTHELDSMQACYVNTTHPDFIGGHKASSLVACVNLLPLFLKVPNNLQATALVTERQNASKSQTVDPKNPKAQVNNNKDLDVDAKKDEPSFFGSFFAAKAGGPKKKGAAIMDTPPTSIRPQNALSERETMETEVISCVVSNYTDIARLEYLILQCFLKQNCLFILILTSSNGR